MKLLFLADRIPPYERGGGGKIPYLLARDLAAAGHECHLISSTPGHAWQEEREGLQIHYLHSRYPDRWRAWLSLYNPQVMAPLGALLKTINPQLIHAHNIHQHLSYAALWLANRFKWPTVFTAHDAMSVAYTKLDHFVGPGGPPTTPAALKLPPRHNLRQMRLRYNPLRNLAIRALMGRLDRRLAVSQALAEALAANGLPPFEVVHNGLDPDDWAPLPESAVQAWRAEQGLGDSRLILWGGRLSEEKGARCLLAALDALVPSFPQLKLLILSASPFDPTWLGGLAHLRPKHLHQTGWLEGPTLRLAYQAAEIVTTPSIYLDPFPTMNLEAMAAAKPVVTTCYGGSAEAVLDGLTGYVVNPLRRDDLSGALAKLLHDPALGVRLGQAGRARLGQHFSHGAFRARMLALYEQVLA
jgi:glycosyltransferase involved in cell wall biosynthesis